MKRKFIAALSVLSISFSLPIIPAHSAVKAGAPCKKAGITSIASNKTFTCIKSGKKYVWNGGVSISDKSKTSKSSTASLKVSIIAQRILSQTILGEREFGGIAISDDGTKLIVSETCTNRDEKGRCINFGNLFTSNDSGLTWVKQEAAGLRYWKGVASSSDGRILHAVSYPGSIYRSEDFGSTWNEIACCNRAYWTISTSADGNRIIAAEYVIPQSSIWTSNDAGKTWINRENAGKRNWNSVSSSLDGSKLVAVDAGGHLYTSDDFGANWKANTAVGEKIWFSVRLSSDGQTIVACAENSHIVLSKDFGISWTTVNTLIDKNWNSVTISGDGTKVFALGDYGSGLYFSQDSGNTWQKWQSLINPGHTELVVSRDGGHLASIPYKGSIKSGNVITYLAK